MTWTEISSRKLRGGRSSCGLTPYVGLRRNYISISLGFLKQANSEECAMVTFWLDAEARCLGFAFHNNVDDKNAYAITKVSTRTRAIVTKLLFSTNKWLREAVTDVLRKYTPKYDQEKGIWYVDLSGGGI